MREEGGRRVGGRSDEAVLLTWKTEVERELGNGGSF